MKKITKTTFISFNNKMKKMDFIPPYNKLDDAIMEMTGGYQLIYENKSNPSKVIINTDNKFNIEDIILYTEYEPIEIFYDGVTWEKIIEVIQSFSVIQYN